MLMLSILFDGSYFSGADERHELTSRHDHADWHFVPKIGVCTIERPGWARVASSLRFHEVPFHRGAFLCVPGRLVWTESLCLLRASCGNGRLPCDKVHAARTYICVYAHVCVYTYVHASIHAGICA